MKRLSLFLFVAFAAVVSAPLDVVVLGSQAYVVPAEVGAAAKAPADITGGGGPVCLALPIAAGGSQGSCKSGQVEVPNDPKTGGAIIFYLKQILFLVNSLIGGIIILVLVIAGVQYIVSGGDPSNVKNAKGRIMNAVTALVLYLMMVAILNFLVPGGLL